MRVCVKDVLYMMFEWKKVIRKKRRYVKRYVRNFIEENWKLMKIWRNIVIRFCWRVIKEYWNKKVDDLKINFKNFYKVFKFFFYLKLKKCENILFIFDIDGVIE